MTFKGNRFVGAMREGSERGKYLGVDDGALYWITESDGVSIEGNVVTQPGPFLKTPVAGTKTAHFEVKP